MSVFLMLLLAIAGLILVVVLLLFKLSADSAKRIAEQQQMINSQLSEQAAHRQVLDQRLADLQERHRVENQEAADLLAGRHEFDNDWGGLSVAGTTADADHAGVAAPQSPGVAGGNEF